MPSDDEETARMRALADVRGHPQGILAGGQNPRLRETQRVHATGAGREFRLVWLIVSVVFRKIAFSGWRGRAC
jgi:hypothetical protein